MQIRRDGQQAKLDRYRRQEDSRLETTERMVERGIEHSREVAQLYKEWENKLEVESLVGTEAAEAGLVPEVWYKVIAVDKLRGNIILQTRNGELKYSIRKLNFKKREDIPDGQD